MSNENHCNYVSSRGIMKSCTIYSNKPISSIRQLVCYDFTELKYGSTLYICSSAIPYFINTIFPKSINTKFILVTGDCDESCPVDLFKNENEFLAFIENDKIIHWFSQNCVFTSHKKLSQIPIGLDYHTMASGNHEWGNQTTPKNQELLLNLVKSKALPFWKREIKCYANFQFLMTTKYGYDRKDAIAKIPNELVYYESNKIKRLQTWTKQSNYAFVISPHGNGLDCHRTWEALCLDCIPIVKTSPLDPLFSDLPVLIVKEWSDVTEKLLNETIVLFENKYNNNEFLYEKLTLQYWVNKINSFK
jgi:hypothetical protein